MTTVKGLQPTQIREVPFTSIGVHDLCSIESNKKGLLRKEGLLARGWKKSPLSKVNVNVQWKQYFVVLSQGCVYVFADESSSSPKKYFSLKNYIKLQRIFGTNVVSNAFELLPELEGGKIHRFCCSTDTERLEWMKAFHVSLLAAHNLPVPDVNPKKKSDEYILVESEIGSPRKSLNELPEALYEVDGASSSDDEQVYDEPEEVAIDDKSKKPKNKYAPDPTSFKYKTTPDQRTSSSPNKAPITSPKVKRSCSFTNVPETVNKVERAKSPCSPGGSVKKVAKEMMEKINLKGARSMSNLSEDKPSVAKDSSNKRYINSSANNAKTKIVNKRYINSSGESNKANTKVDSSKPGKEGSDNKMYLNLDSDPGYVEPNAADNPYMEYMFDGDKEDSARALEISPARTFLIRNSSEPGKKVLVVKNTDRNLRSFKIDVDASNSNYHIELYVTFSSLRDLVEHYKRHKLPNLGFTLRLGYNAREDEPDEDGYEPVAKPWKSPLN